MRKKDLPIGWISFVTLIIIGVERLLVEFVRTTSPSFIPGISQAQLISFGFIVVGAYKRIQLKSQARRSIEVKG